MTCTHLRQLYDLCQQHDVKLSGADLVHFVCHQCGEVDVCPSALWDELEARQDSTSPPAAQEGPSTGLPNSGAAAPNTRAETP